MGHVPEDMKIFNFFVGLGPSPLEISNARTKPAYQNHLTTAGSRTLRAAGVVYFKKKEV